MNANWTSHFKEMCHAWVRKGAKLKRRSMKYTYVCFKSNVNDANKFTDTREPLGVGGNVGQPARIEISGRVSKWWTAGRWEYLIFHTPLHNVGSSQLLSGIHQGRQAASRADTNQYSLELLRRRLTLTSMQRRWFSMTTSDAISRAHPQRHEQVLADSSQLCGLIIPSQKNNFSCLVLVDLVW